MNEIFSFTVGFLLGLLVVVFIMSKYLTIFRVNYRIVLRDDEGNTVKILNGFTRYYWKESKADKDITDLEDECLVIRSNYVGGKDFILSLINENYEIDYKKIYIEYNVDRIKPR